jgi:hypothetical protein
MVFDLSAGDVVRFGDDVILTILAVEDDRIRFRLESAEECPHKRVQSRGQRIILGANVDGEGG